jgi:homocitrate synthase
MTIQQFNIIESTLREGEQFALAHFTTAQKIEIARALDAFGVEYIEVTSPSASPQSERDAAAIAALGLRCKVLTHTRCHMDDARKAVATGVDGVDVLFGTSRQMREHSHGKSIEQIIATATEVITYIRDQGREVRFSSEDSFRSDPADLLRIYRAVDALGLQRVGLADTVGIATPRQVFELVSLVRENVHCDIEFHAHNDTGCAIANCLSALEGGVTHVDTTVLGIGERNGITSLGGMIARLITIQPELVRKYRLDLLPELDRMVAGILGMEIPFNNFITGPWAFHHKAGLHTKAVLNNPSTYEIFDPADFGMERTIAVGHRLTGHNAVANRAQELGLKLEPTVLRALTQEVKRRGDERPFTTEELDELLRSWVPA